MGPTRCSRGSSSRATETVLDAGCGSGRVTRLLLDRLPEGRVIGVDGSPSMVEKAREQLVGYGERIELIVADLGELELERAGRRRLLERDLPLDPRPRAALRAPASRRYARRRARRPVRRRRTTSPSVKRAIEAAEGDERFSAYLRGMPDSPGTSPPWTTRRPRLAAAGFEVGARSGSSAARVTPPDPRALRPLGRPRQASRPSCPRTSTTSSSTTIVELDDPAADARVRAPQHLRRDGPDDAREIVAPARRRHRPRDRRGGAARARRRRRVRVQASI